MNDECRMREGCLTAIATWCERKGRVGNMEVVRNRAANWDGLAHSKGTVARYSSSLNAPYVWGLETRAQLV